jgi:surface antigen
MTTPAANTNAQPAKKQYEPPRLEVYGDIRQITQTVGRDGDPDGGHGAHGRTA